jgi:hypothetical protein
MPNAKRKKVAKKKSGARNKRQVAVTEMSFAMWVDSLRAAHEGKNVATMAMASALAEPSVGACLLKSPSGGGKVCVATTKNACIMMGGTFKGGACGGR